MDAGPSRIAQNLINCVENSYRHYDTYRLFRHHTMIAPRVYTANLKLATSAADIPGAVVECGTWKGGMIAGIARILGPRDYWLFDSFAGLPEAEPIDGPKARKWQANTTSRRYYNNCAASEDDAAEAMQRTGIPNPHLVKGWFEDSLPTAVFPHGIAILRMDADWYKSTYQILDSLFPQVNEDGLIVVDDYRTWEGCRKAVHDYLNQHDRRERIKKFRNIYYMTKLPG